MQVSVNGNGDVRDLLRVERVGVHSHIRGLGLNAQLEASAAADGLVGQTTARRALGLIQHMIQEGRIVGRAVVITGEPGTGKTALAVGLSKSLGADTPFVSLMASEIYSVDVSTTESLTQALRKAIGVQITEETEVIEGEVVAVEVDRPAQGTGAKIGRLTLKTTDMEAVYDLGAKMAEACIRERIQAGDVVQIDKASGRVTRLGRAYSRSNDYDATSATTKFVPCPSGELQQRRSSAHVVALHDIDVINSRTQGYRALFSGDTGEIKPEVREQISRKVVEWREEGKAAIVPGVLFIDEAHLLDLESFSFLNRALELDLAPILILATNKAVAKIRGTNEESPHGMPLDFLDRSLIICTQPYSPDETNHILRMRIDEEGVKLDATALKVLSTVANKTSLRYAMQLIATSAVYASFRKSDTISGEDVSNSYKHFMDVERSSNRLAQEEASYLH